ncbi:MAG: ATP-binding cassette domain-containing protein [Phascolarctobacterium sp.]|nr:ATP-binding cassette domain-containing protein [Phascolarctobacterium sp.]
MLRVENICKTFFAGTINEKKALQGLSLHLKPGDFVTVIGGNGAGKSTLMNSIAGVFQSTVERSLLTVMILQKRRNINGPNILGVSSRIR